jgi:hypothetical protein
LTRNSELLVHVCDRPTRRDSPLPSTLIGVCSDFPQLDKSKGRATGRFPWNYSTTPRGLLIQLLLRMLFPQAPIRHGQYLLVDYHESCLPDISTRHHTLLNQVGLEIQQRWSLSLELLSGQVNHWWCRSIKYVEPGYIKCRSVQNAIHDSVIYCVYRSIRLFTSSIRVPLYTDQF